MKIVVLDGHSFHRDLGWNVFADLGELKVYERTNPNDAAEIIARIGDADIIFTNAMPLTRKIFDACPSVKYVGILATGYNLVDLQAAREKNITVTNVPNYGTQAVAQFTFALLLEICNRVAHHSREVHGGRCDNSNAFCFWDYRLIELAGKTLGIIGYGNIGQVTAKIAQSFGMKVIAFSKHREIGTKHGDCSFVALDELFARSDVISLHCMLNSTTQGIICRKNIEKMRDGVIIINTSRGGVIIEKDLREALDNGKIFAAGVDVVSSEPISRENPLFGAKNCFITPHIAWAPLETRSRLLNIAADNLKAWLAGKSVNVVNL